MRKSLQLCSSLKRNSSNLIHYKLNEFKFRDIVHRRRKSPQSKQIIVSNNPWSELNNSEIKILLERLTDSPAMIYKVIKEQKQEQRQKELTKFKLMNQYTNPIDKKIRKQYEQLKQYFQLMVKKSTKPQARTNLPKLIKIGYVPNNTIKSLKIRV